MSDETADRIGTVLGERYALDELLGSGGMGAVYGGRHVITDAKVAIKVLHRQFSNNEQIRRRFLAEGRTANRIDHPAIVRVTDAGEEKDGTAFLVMDRLVGRSLQSLLDEKRRLPVADVVRWGESLLGVLAVAHAAKIVHRDLKPDNLFITKDGTLRVLDFGIASVRDDSAATKLTKSGLLMGTPGFMAPEQAFGHANQIEARTDLWAVGATLYVLASGVLAHESQSESLTAAPLATIAPHLPSGFCSVVDKALALERSQRWPSATVMQEELRKSLHVEPPVAAKTAFAAPIDFPPPPPPFAPTAIAPVPKTEIATEISEAAPPISIPKGGTSTITEERNSRRTLAFVFGIPSAILVVAVAWGIFGGSSHVDEEADAEPAASASASAVIEDSTPAPEPKELGIVDVTLGDGPLAETGDKVDVKYTGTFTDGGVFDSTDKQGKPATFSLGNGQLIKGFEQGVLGMRVGGKRRVTIPPALGYGERKVGSIPPGSTLVFDIELVGIKKS